MTGDYFTAFQGDITELERIQGTIDVQF